MKHVRPFAKANAGATSTMSMLTILLRRCAAMARADGRTDLPGRGHCSRHYRGVETVGVDRELDRAALISWRWALPMARRPI